MKDMNKKSCRKKRKSSDKNPEEQDNSYQVQYLLDYFSKIDTDTRQFYIRTILKIYYLLNETK